MKKIYRINVEGKKYEVELEEVSSIEGHIESTPIQAQTSASVVTGNSTIIKAPMPGNIFEIRVKVGDTVSKGQIVAVLEAMKMETEIMSDVEGKVTAINASKGANVVLNEAIITIN